MDNNIKKQNIKIIIMDKVAELINLKTDKPYEVIRIETIGDDTFFIVLDEEGKEQSVIDMIAIELE